MEIYFFPFFLLKRRILNIIYKTNRALKGRGKVDQLGISEPEEWQLTPENKLPELSFASHIPGVEMKQQQYRKAHKHRSQKPQQKPAPSGQKTGKGSLARLPGHCTL